MSISAVIQIAVDSLSAESEKINKLIDDPELQIDGSLMLLINHDAGHVIKFVNGRPIL